MIVARRSGVSASIRSSTRPGLRSRPVRPSASSASRLMTQSSSPSAASASKVTTLVTPGDRGGDAAQLGDLLGVLGEDDLALGVAEDERDVVVDRRRVDRRRDAAGDHDAEVGQGPLVAGGRGEGDAVLGPDAQRDEPGTDRVDRLLDLGPGDGDPLVAGLADLGVHERVRVGGRRDAVTEEVPDTGGALLDQAVVDRLVGRVSGSGAWQQACRVPRHWGALARNGATAPPAWRACSAQT